MAGFHRTMTDPLIINDFQSLLTLGTQVQVVLQQLAQQP